MRKAKHTFIILMIMISGFGGLLIITQPAESEYTPHDPILIDGNDDFAAQAASEGWSGDGSEGNPYVIEGYEINASEANGIEITSTSVFFVIRNSIVKDGDKATGYYHNHGIYLYKVLNGTIENCTLNNNRAGIYLYFAYNNKIMCNQIYDNKYIGMHLERSCWNVIEGNSFSNNSYGMQLSWLSNGNNITNNSVIKNKNHGISLYGSNWNNITNNIIQNQYEGISLSDESNHNAIKNNNISNNREGISVQFSCMNNVISNNEISNNELGIQIGERGTQKYKSDSNNITANTLIGNDMSVYLYTTGENHIANNVIIGDGIYIEGNQPECWINHTIESSNSVNGKPLYFWKNKKGGTVPYGAGQIIIANCTGVVIEDQEISNIRIGITLGYSDNNSILNNMVTSNKENGIFLKYSNGNEIINNQVSSNNLDGINLFSSNNNNIKNNNVLENRRGIFLESSNDNNIEDNIVNSNNWDGIDLIKVSNGNQIIDNEINSNNWSGISLWGCKYTDIVDNEISDNDDGIWLSGSSGNNISRNLISSNKRHGLYFQSSNNNIIYYNNIIDNTFQVNSTDCTNLWSDGSGEGNYWSDYNGTDNDGDGVGDTNLPHHGVDHYPLMKPFGSGDDDTILPELLYIILGIILIFLIIRIFSRPFRKKKSSKSQPGINEQEDVPGQKDQTSEDFPPLNQQNQKPE